MSEIPEEHRQRAIRKRLANMQTTPLAAFPTGFARLDAALGGGIPRGRIIELYGPASSGKTTLALQILATLQQTGLSAAWIDAEHTFDPAYAASLGVVIERLPVAQPDSAEQALEIARRLAASGAVDLLAIDSAAALVPSLELATALGTSAPGLHGRVMASGLRSLAMTLARVSVSALFLNHARGRMEASADEGETSAGGPALKLYAAVRIALRPAPRNRVNFRVLKNKASAAFGEGEFVWKSGVGFAETP
ncbi:MAG TPA: ATPase domain-containing protein [Bryobacteraceae bacterium]|nr:ATPase domain-containing protein [Bryobacteraceae bacterium]